MGYIASIRQVMQHAGRASLYAPLQVLLYSSNASVRIRVQQALGQLPDSRTPPLDFVNTATQPAVLAEMASGRINLVILDAEAAPSGGIGLAKQLKDELLQCPPIVVIIARPDDAWLADWSGADAVVSVPVDPIVLTETVIPLLRSRLIG
jgi:DNA-binding NarL/FixJ family response regulator